MLADPLVQTGGNVITAIRQNRDRAPSEHAFRHRTGKHIFYIPRFNSHDNEIDLALNHEAQQLGGRVANQESEGNLVVRQG